jgi:S1-C subfamily serine protease
VVVDARPRPRPGGRRRALTLAGAGAVALALAGAAGGLAAILADEDAPSSASVATPLAAAPGGGAPGLADAVSVAAPSVVQVRTDSGAQGSGVVLAPSGLVVTNEHVVGGAQEIRLITTDGRGIVAALVRADAPGDLAVLRPAQQAGVGAVMADEPGAGLRAGDAVFAIGSPFQLQNTVTAGVVSAVDRPNPQSGVPMIQIDAPINPGNSGGGLFDLRGRLVGIPTSILAPIQANVGIGFAVPASRVKRLVESVP